MVVFRRGEVARDANSLLAALENAWVRMRDAAARGWREGVAEIVAHTFWRFLAFLGICIVASAFWRRFCESVLIHGYGWICLAAAMVIAVAGIRVRARDMPAPSLIILRVILGVIGFYLAASAPIISVAGLDQATQFLLGYGRVTAVLCAFGAAFRPSVALVPLTYLMWFKAALSTIAGLPISGIDYMALIEVGDLLIFAQLIWQLWWSRHRSVSMQDTPGCVPDGSLSSLERLCLFAVAVHLANYFMSAWAKARLGDSPLSWVLENNTQYLMSNALEMKLLPLSFSPRLTALVYEGLGRTIIVSNAIIFIGQLVALFVLLRIRWAIAVMIFYDLTHVIIYLTTGVLFWKWIALNAGIVFGLTTIREKSISVTTGCLLILMVALSSHFFYVAALGWWDTPVLVFDRVFAITKDGKAVLVPTNFWGPYSVTGAQSLFGTDLPGFPQLAIFGTTVNDAIWRKAERCDLAPIAPQGTGKLLVASTFADFARRYHAGALDAAGSRNNWMYDIYPHHIFSSFWEFREFQHLDLHQVTQYRFVRTAECLRYGQGRFDRRIIRQTSYRIALH